MKKILGILMGVVMFAGIANAQEVTVLPKPKINGGMDVMKAIEVRKTERDFNKDKKLSTETISEILWVAYGKNSRGTRTIPTARNQLDMNVYVLMGSGTYFYDGDKHALVQINDKDLRPIMAKQDFVKDAAMTIVYTGKDPHYAALHAGSSYQNVGLYCAAKGIKAVVRGLFDKDDATKALGLKGDEKAVTSITLGY